MNVTLRVPSMTRDQFLDWAAMQDMPYEFDGFDPVAMTGGTRRHGLLCVNLLLAIHKRLESDRFEVLPEVGLATPGHGVRYPDLAILPAGGDQNDRLMPDVIVVFEVASPSTVRLDRTIKLREYRTVPSILRYVIVDSAAPDLAVFSRSLGTGEWVATVLMVDEVLAIPEVGIDIPVSEIFKGVTFD